MAKKNLSVYLCFLLRHKPEEIGLAMDSHGWVSVEDLIFGINRGEKYTVTRAELESIVAEDQKGRYRFSPDHTRIKACQGHSIPWVTPELETLQPPQALYHGTTTVALEKIMRSGAIEKMARHAVHLHADMEVAWKSATRWHLVPILLKINAEQMAKDGFVFGKTENDVWCIESVPIRYIEEQIKMP